MDRAVVGVTIKQIFELLIQKLHNSLWLSITPLLFAQCPLAYTIHIHMHQTLHLNIYGILHNVTASTHKHIPRILNGICVGESSTLGVRCTLTIIISNHMRMYYSTFCVWNMCTIFHSILLYFAKSTIFRARPPTCFSLFLSSETKNII